MKLAPKKPTKGQNQRGRKRNAYRRRIVPPITISTDKPTIPLACLKRR